MIMIIIIIIIIIIITPKINCLFKNIYVPLIMLGVFVWVFCVFLMRFCVNILFFFVFILLIIVGESLLLFVSFFFCLSDIMSVLML